MKSKLCMLFFLYTMASSAQGEASTWYFGHNAGLKFLSDGSVLPLSDGLLYTDEGCSTISDANGNLLFYTDGRTVWDRNHVVMPNGNYFGGTGLFGDPSSTQSGIIIPRPNYTDQYYVFTVDEPHHENALVYPTEFSGDYAETGSGNVPNSDDGKNNGFNYSIIDLSINGSNGSFGDVVTRNIHLITYDINPNGEQIKYKCSEKITAVKNETDNSYWVITHFVNKFYAFKVDENGVSTTPVITTIGSSQELTGYRRNAIGYLKASPNGEKIVIAHQQNGIQTGLSSYGTGSVELFDFDIATGIVSNYLPILPNIQGYGIEFSPSSERLYATYRIGTSPMMELAQFDLTQPSPETTKQIIFNSANYLFALQLAPNNKIYCATGYQNSLGVINNPDNLGTACNYIQQGQELTSGKLVQLGLPPFITSFFNASIIVSNNCLGENTYFNLNSNQTISSAFWDFGDGSTSNEINPSHLYTTAGSYMVTVTAVGEEGVITKTKSITIFTVLTSTAIASQSICSNYSSYQLSQNDDLLLDSQSPSLFAVIYFGSYTNALENSNQLPDDYFLTNGQNIFFAKIINRQNPTCFVIQPFEVIWFLQPNINTPTDYVVCDNSPYTNNVYFDLTQKNNEILGNLNPTLFGVSYHQTLEDAQLGTNAISSPYLATNTTETIYVRIFNYQNISCYSTTYFSISVIKKPIVHEVSNWYECGNADTSVTFDLLQKNDEILNGQSNSEFFVSYHLTLDDSILNSNALSQYLTLTTNPKTIYVRITNQINESCFSLSSFEMEIFPNPEVELKTEYTICDGNFITIESPSGFDAYLWSTGEISSTIDVSQAGNYQLTVFKNYGNITCDTSIEFFVTNVNSEVIDQIIISDWTLNNNSIEILMSGNGNHSYSLDGINFQDSPIFYNLSSGEYFVYVKDNLGCGILKETISILMYPYFFTPNGDGYNDSWQIFQGHSEPSLEVLIFDRYGKLLKTFFGDSIGWDGTSNGVLLPSSDYWFIVKRENGKIHRGHFTLKR